MVTAMNSGVAVFHGLNPMNILKASLLRLLVHVPPLIRVRVSLPLAQELMWP
jgi:hypothetical protein